MNMPHNIAIIDPIGKMYLYVHTHVAIPNIMRRIPYMYNINIYDPFYKPFYKHLYFLSVFDSTTFFIIPANSSLLIPSANIAIMPYFLGLHSSPHSSQ